jgi:lipopolysaccharide heptosyltransferase II
MATDRYAENRLPGSINRILVIRLDNIGDVIMTGPALRALRAAYPQANMTLLASPAGTQAACLLPWIDDVITWRASWQDIGPDARVDPAKEQELVDLLAQRGFDAAFIFTSFSQSPYPPAYICALAGIPLRIGQSKEFGGALLSHWQRPLPDQVHQVERNLHLLRMLGVSSQGDHLELGIPFEDQAHADVLLEQAGIDLSTGFICLAPGASAAARRYPLERYARAARLLIRQAKLPVVVIGSPREAGQFKTLDEMAKRTPGLVSLIGKTTLPESAAILRRARLVIANNSGPMHITAAFRRPMLVMYSGTEHLEQWAPNYRQLRFLYRETDCSPCHAFQCPYNLECLDISAEEVVQASLRLLHEPLRPVTRPQMEEHDNPTQPVS